MSNVLSGCRLLVVEDELLVLLMIEDMLADLGCESVVAAATIEQAIALIEARPFDAAMLDVNLNGTNSHPVADALVARGVPFLFSTGNSGQHMKDRYRDRPVLRKPFKFEELAAIVTSLLSPKEAPRA